MTTNYARGHLAEVYAAKHLKRIGYVIHAINWKNRWGEIDIIVERQQVLYFVEVKYRLTDAQGRGLDYITPKKLEQMAFAAQMWIQNSTWTGDYCLAALEVYGEDFHLSELLVI